VKIQFRLLRDRSESPVRILVEDFETVIAAASYTQHMMNNGVTDTLHSATGDELVAVDWSKITIAYVEPIE
jgi:hypothetical protein